MLSVIVLIILTSVLSYTLKDKPYFEFLESLSVSIFLILLSVSVAILCYAGIRDGKFTRQEDKYKKDHESAYGAIIMPMCVAIFLFLGFVHGLWHPGWIVFPIGGLLCGVISAIANIKKDKDK